MNYFSYYTQFFNTVEINSTFYHIPLKQTLQKWYQQAPSGFIYSLKVNRHITHLKKFHQTQEEIKNFYGLCEILKEKMGCFLFQLPGSFQYTEEHLENILSQLDPVYSNVVEFRHSSWWIPEVFQAFQSANILFCSVSGLSVPEDPINVTNSEAYIRFHGNARYEPKYPCTILKEWKRKINLLPLKCIWIYFNNTRLGYAPYDALEFEKYLKENV